MATLQNYLFVANGPDKLEGYGYNRQPQSAYSDDWWNVDNGKFLRYRVPLGKKFVAQAINISVNPVFFSATGIINQGGAGTQGVLGTWGLWINGTQCSEWRFQGNESPVGLDGYDEGVTPYHNAFQSPSLGEGVIVAAGQEVEIRAYCPIETPSTVFATMAGMENGAVQIQNGIFTLTNTTYARLLRYTPSNDFTLKTVYCQICQGAQYWGRIMLKLGSSPFMQFAPFGLDLTRSVPFAEDGWTGYGLGCINFPLQGLTFYEGEEICVVACPELDDNSRWTALLSGTESDIQSTGGGGVYITRLLVR